MIVKIGFDRDPIYEGGRGSDRVIRALDKALGGANWSKEGEYFVAETEEQI